MKPRLLALAALALVVCWAFVAANAALAVTGGRARASASARVVSASNNASLGKKIVVDTHGRTLYALSPEGMASALALVSQVLDPAALGPVARPGGNAACCK